MLVALLLVVAVLPDHDRRRDAQVASNVTNVFLQNGYILVMALGMLLVIVIGHIDLSVGSVAGFLGRDRRRGPDGSSPSQGELDPLLAVAVTLSPAA